MVQAAETAAVDHRQRTFRLHGVRGLPSWRALTCVHVRSVHWRKLRRPCCLAGAGAPVFPSFASHAKGAERRQAQPEFPCARLLRNARRLSALPAPSPAWLRATAGICGSGAPESARDPGRAFAGAAAICGGAGRQRAPRGPVVMPAGRSPGPPGITLARRERGRRTAGLALAPFRPLTGDPTFHDAS